MFPRSLIATYLTLPAAPAMVFAQGGTEAKTGYAALHGLRCITGFRTLAGHSCFSHGALSNIDTDFGKLLPELAKQRQVIAVEQQAHGHTADADRPLTYAQMAPFLRPVTRFLRTGLRCTLFPLRQLTVRKALTAATVTTAIN